MDLIRAVVPNRIVFHAADCPDAEQGALTFEAVTLTPAKLKAELERPPDDEHAPDVEAHACIR